MATVDLYDESKKKVGTFELRDDIFAARVNIPLVHQVIKAQRAGQRQGTAKTKTKAEVRGGGKKPYKQKGTGNARMGSTRSPLCVGGGVSFGPLPRSYTQSTPKRMVRGALRSALSDRFAASRLLVMDNLDLNEIKSKKISEIFKKNFGLENVLVVDQENQKVERSSKNVFGVNYLETDRINVYDIVKHDWLVLTKKSVEALQDRLDPKKDGVRGKGETS